MKKRQSGVLMHISSLPGKYGIGSFGQSAYDFVDFLVRTKQRYWQILPLGTTSYGDSPYQSFSAFAGNTHFIDLEFLAEEGFLQRTDFEGRDFGCDPSRVDYEKLFKERCPILEKAVARFLEIGDKASYQSFVEKNQSWLENFVDYMAIKEHFGQLAWTEWPDQAIKERQPEALAAYRQQLSASLDYHRITQYFFFKQWFAVKNYANQKGIEIIGDMPIYVAADSCEMWANPHYFKTDEDRRPLSVAGCPPDDFSADGQLWGNPIYDWQAMEADGYAWWIERLKESFRLYDVVRIDHFRGFESFWEIPAGSTTAATGKWTKGPDIALFKAVQEKLGDLNIIAEDLGFLTDEVIALREKTSFPGMKVLQFAFDAEGDSMELPHNYKNNSVAYTGTHDNHTILGWYETELSEESKDFLDRYTRRHPDESVNQAMLRTLFSSVSYMAIATMQDLLELDDGARMNLPNTVGGNWEWRMTPEQFTDKIEKELLDYTELYRRTNSYL